MDNKTLKSLLINMEIEASDASTFTKSLPSTVIELFEKYKRYRNTTLEWGYGATARFCMMYVELIDLYHHFSRAVRTGEHTLYIYALSEMLPMFYVFNHQNYAKWGTK